ncbi:hypothetical protein CHU32_26140 [Superficieibacter electus]|uniref:Uncharacterized protein n=1 Tax=Superficieibacter electus TaxID=2022662 RepID=A0A2P5GHD5_9ENTR|nr:hypothetical protein [Superficieibacter electus]POP40661.1 hypothetical protein CHU33_26225 [Superficieibacter electus]POP41825.1 hypothetical protein CHU32_26140 [Superficieibacter electus]
MITYQDLVNGFGESIETLKDGVFKFKIEVPAFTLFNYLWCKRGSGDFLLLSKNIEDDKFVSFIYSQLSFNKKITSLNKVNISTNHYGFDSLLLAPSGYHGHFNGVLDDKRSELILCSPIYHHEFSGNESVDEFREMRTRRVHIDRWDRKPEPKILVRFNNTKTGGGTIGNEYILMSDARLKSEIHNLNGVVNGFIEVENYLGERIIISTTVNTYQLRLESGEVVVSESILNEKINDFLTR